MAKFNVHLFAIPRVSDDGKSVVPTPDFKVQSFDALEPAQKFAAENKSKWDRVVLMSVDDSGTALVERYRDGDHETAAQIVRR
jgi:hypothetical protein